MIQLRSTSRYAVWYGMTGSLRASKICIAFYRRPPGRRGPAAAPSAVGRYRPPARTVTAHAHSASDRAQHTHMMTRYGILTPTVCRAGWTLLVRAWAPPSICSHVSGPYQGSTLTLTSQGLRHTIEDAESCDEVD